MQKEVSEEKNETVVISRIGCLNPEITHWVAFIENFPCLFIVY